MKKSILKAACFASFTFLSGPINLQAHCQMPCGIYHDDMVYDFIDQYVETMIKAVTVMNQNKFETVRDKNEFVRWVIEKEKESTEISNLITSFFMQQKIKPGETDTAKRIEAAHKLLCLIVSIKQNADIKIIESFNDEWEKFKLMFHVEGYECKIEQLKIKKRELLLKEKEHHHDHDDEDHKNDHKH